MIVKKTSVFPASPETVYEKIRRIETLRQVSAPYVSFEPWGEESGVWEDGSTSSWRLRLMGVIPFGIHRIHIVRFGPDGISSREGNQHVSVWNHDITLAEVDENHTEYTDRVEIRAGWKTVFVWLWAEMFYVCRQRKWIRLHKETEMDDKRKSKSYPDRHSGTFLKRKG